MRNNKFYEFSDAYARLIEASTEDYAIFSKKLPDIIDFIEFDINSKTYIRRPISTNEKSSNNDIRLKWITSKFEKFEEITNVVCNRDHVDVSYKEFFGV
ncbi:hypothetical protein PTQ21_12220 [Paenibacillus marchantiae]|uniref:hypothetical protein n=1 Tax=Paenibacillus marchantiae TaxID=3026433 RepID=UPI00237C41B5|nr:hypothetical protein [Paenibacillus marchantiae]WDQ34955.1 hypothetical protein PTQ21_12220 [Paenibacillus marchantiae]